MRRIYLYISFMTIVCCSWSQVVDSTLSGGALPSVQIHVGSLVHFETGHNRISFDSTKRDLSKGLSLSESLRVLGIGQVRTYGVYGLSSPTFRGTGAAHTAVLWNGANIQSPLNGQLDFSLLPTSLSDNIELQLGGTASLHGSGAIGGTVQYSDEPSYGQGLQLSFSQRTASFNAFFQEGGLAWSNERWYSSLAIFHRVIENDFTYQNDYLLEKPEEVREHAGFEQWGLMEKTEFKANERHKLGLRFWFQDNNLEVAQPLTHDPGEATQQEKALRSQLYWHYKGTKGSASYHLTFQDHGLVYRDPEIALDSKSEFLSYQHQLRGERVLSDQFELSGGLNWVQEQGEAGAYGGLQPSRDRLAVLGSLTHSSESRRWKSTMNVRQALVDDDVIPFSLSLGTEWIATEFMRLHGTLSRSYRLPTFNDLYWQGSGARGNPDLLPEDAWGQELGVRLFHQSLFLHVNAFSNTVHNWILWSDVGGGIWQPENVKRVWGRGLECKAGFEPSWKRLDLRISANYTITKTTNEALHDGISPLVLGKQLMYTPLHQGGLNVRLSRNDWQLLVASSWSGLQYSDQENLPIFALEGYSLTDVYVSRSLSWSRQKATVRASVQNLFNAAYEARRAYPMPGRHYALLISFKFQQTQPR